MPNFCRRRPAASRLNNCAHLNCIFAAFLAAATLVFATSRAKAEDSASDRVRVPEGFEVTVFADDNLAHDIFAMTIDSQGRVVVSGAGYVRILVDNNSDGRADESKVFADGPKTGAQGLYFLGRDLFCIGDEGLLRYRDADGDDRADGPPDLFLRCKTGSEHHVHSIQKGPDGWWYLIAGNYAGITASYATLATSPIKQPEAGTLLRLKPDLSGGEIVADGFRNAYDFAFNGQGDIFTFDSDGERDISLPWYLPTRVFHVVPGSHAGWVSRSWKRPDAYPDMPPVVAEFGRGSPTGVVNYRHRQFPKKYHDALFVLDWTFGRVMAVPLKRSGSTWSTEPISFMTGVGQFGFAPTDAEVGPDGSLYISVGGRGTRGTVFRVTYTGPRPDEDSTETHAPTDKLAACLNAPQPLSSWSRAKWEPAARELGKEPFVQAALDPSLSPAERIRAIEIITELFGGLDAQALKTLAGDASAPVRARAAWSLGRTQTDRPDADLMRAYLGDSDPLVARFAAEALLGAGGQTDFATMVPALAAQLGHADRFLRQAAVRVAPKLNTSDYQTLSWAATRSGWQAGLSNAFGYVLRHPGFNAYALDIGLRVLESDNPVALKREAVRLMQLGLGDMGPQDKRPAVYDGYASRLDLSAHERELDPVRIRAAALFPTGDAELDYELGRLLAMLTPYNPKLLDKVLEKITGTSHPVDDVHYLIVASRIPVARTSEHAQKTAQALAGMEPKLAARGLNQDSNWGDRIRELYARLVELDPELPYYLLEDPQFGRPGHVLFLGEFPADLLQRSIEAFVRNIRQDDDYPWSNDVIFVLAASADPAHRELIRAQFDRFAVRNAVLVALSENPTADDRAKFLEGLESSQLEVLGACLDALAKLPASSDGEDQVALVRTLRRLGTEDREYPVREKVVRLLQRNTAQNFGFEFGQAGHRPQPDVIQKWTGWIEQSFPEIVAKQFGTNEGYADFQQLLAQVDWEHGDVGRGEKLFATRSCTQCHGGRVALGPDLAGAAQRFSRDDLFTAIVLPNRDVSPRYQTTLIETTAGKVYTGLIVYQSVDGLTLRNGTNQTFRIEADEIEFQRKLNTSLMPTGLLKDLGPGDLADLYAYIRSLGNPRTASGAANSE